MQSSKVTVWYIIFLLLNKHFVIFLLKSSNHCQLIELEDYQKQWQSDDRVYSKSLGTSSSHGIAIALILFSVIQQTITNKCLQMSNKWAEYGTLFQRNGNLSQRRGYSQNGKHTHVSTFEHPRPNENTFSIFAVLIKNLEKHDLITYKKLVLRGINRTSS